ncbi:MAG: chromosome segregation protein SMC [Nanoarchaeota archaeon]|nr:chromosome segregation protein SMC [Nanoarchaeota archaeon]
MAHIKELVMKGFKSFNSEVKIPMSNGMNVIVGPNGSGKSNIADGICFVLGRLSAKSMRAKKSSNLIFSGTHQHKNSNEAYVKIKFDNSDNKFNLPHQEVVIERLVRKNGGSVYKINNETKTRQEILEHLARAEIDPNGFNIVMQGEITEMIRASSEERRKILEEVSGISVYESRKLRSLKELEKTDAKLKEISTILRERTTYLRNLENERKQALRYKQLETNVKKYKASIVKRKIDSKLKEIQENKKNEEEKSKLKNKIKEQVDNNQNEITNIEQEIDSINNIIKKSTGIEQETLYSNLTDIRADLAGLTVKKENNESRLDEVIRRRERSKDEISDYENEIKLLREQSPQVAQKQEELKKKRQELGDIEQKKKDFYKIKTKLDSIKETISDKQIEFQNTKKDSEYHLKEIENLLEGIEKESQESLEQHISNLKQKHQSILKQIETHQKNNLDFEKSLSVSESEIQKLENLKNQVSEIDICPICKSKITESHKSHVHKDSDEQIKSHSEKIVSHKKELEEIEKNLSQLKKTIEKLTIEIPEKEKSISKINSANEKQEFLKRLVEKEKTLETQISTLKNEKQSLESSIKNIQNIDEIYETTLLEIEEISARTDENIDVSLEFKERELEKIKIIIKQSIKDEQILKEDIQELTKEIDEKTSQVEDYENKEGELNKKHQNLLDKKTQLQKQIQDKNSLLINFHNGLGKVDSELNNIKIEKARLNAEHETQEIDFEEFKGIETIRLSLEELNEKLSKTQQTLDSIGTVNLKSLEVYDEIKKEYDRIAGKSQTIENEKLEILKIVEEIDNKKRRTFMRTFRDLNELFSRNFLQLSSKGKAFLELENKEDPFAAGVNILIKVAKGKYFDINSLSGGEKTLVALSMIFAIQEYKPYSFYIFDEIDAALDKRNSERLAALIRKHMQNGQYIVVTHNDALISESSSLYGVSMQDGISKVLSLKI